MPHIAGNRYVIFPIYISLWNHGYLRAPLVYTPDCVIVAHVCMQSVLVASRTGRAAHSDDIEVPFIGITFAVLVCACTSLAPLTQLLPSRVRGAVYVSFCPAVRFISPSAGMTLYAVEPLWSFVLSGVCTQRICTACQHKRACDSSCKSHVSWLFVGLLVPARVRWSVRPVVLFQLPFQDAFTATAARASSFQLMALGTQARESEFVLRKTDAFTSS